MPETQILCVLISISSRFKRVSRTGFDQPSMTTPGVERGPRVMTGEDERFRQIESAPEWSHEVFDTCAELAERLKGIRTASPVRCPARPIATLKRTWPCEDEFVEALRKMRSVERIEEFFRSNWYRRFNANGYKYWTMGASLDHILINWAIHAPPVDPYAADCDSYDLAIHERESDVERSRRVYESLKIEPGTDILDIGCGRVFVDFRSGASTGRY